MKQEWKWYVYILECEDGFYYTGMTWNLENRFDQHCLGRGSKFTQRHGVKAVRYVEEFTNVEDARRREHQMKDFSRKKKEALWASSQRASNHIVRAEREL